MSLTPPHTDLVLSTFGATPAGVIEAAQLAESLGYGAVWIFDHMSGAVEGRAPILEVWSMLGALAANTGRIKIGPMVTNVLGRHPAVTAMAAATMQQISGNRLMLGVGAGAGPGSPWAVEFSMLGLPLRSAADRRAMVTEAIALMRALWGGESDLDGEHFSLSGAYDFLTTDSPPPIIVGANGPKMAALAGTFANGVNIHSTQDGWQALAEVARAAAAERGTSDFMTTIEAELDESWFDENSALRADLRAVNPDRITLRVRTPFNLDLVRRAGERLGS